MPFPLAAALPIVGKVIDRVLPDKATKDAAKLAFSAQGRQADINSRYASDQQRLGAVQSMANATLQAQQLEDQRILQNAALLNGVGNQQQRQTQAELDAPFRALEIRNNTLRGTPYPQTQVSTTESGGGGKGGLLNNIGSIAGGISKFGALMSHSSTKTNIEASLGVLDKLERLNINYWSYREGRPFSDGKKHVGPMAEDVHDVFGVGDGLTLDAFDLLGIALSALKDLSKEVRELKHRTSPQSN